MATIEYWIQIENHAWDISPTNINRMDGQQLVASAVNKNLLSPETMVTQMRSMFKPLTEEALILRRYTSNWAAPDDRKVNPWDLNEPDPTDTGTMGTIPGATIECNVGDTVVVHFRNKDMRTGKDVKALTHSLHPHGFVFAPTSDGAYPLSPPDKTQPVGSEAALWASVGVGGFKKGDRVPPPPVLGAPGGTFTYTWNTFGWPTTAGVWLYHDHSICDMDNVNLGAIGIIVIHNNDPSKHSPSDPDDVTVDVVDLPNGSPNGSLTHLLCFPFPFEAQALPHDLEGVGQVGHHQQEPMMQDMPGGGMPMGGKTGGMKEEAEAARPTEEAVQPESGEVTTKRTLQESPMATTEKEGEEVANEGTHHIGQHIDEPVMARLIERGNLLLEFNQDFSKFQRQCNIFYQDPPAKAQYLLLMHTLKDVGMCINGRQFMGNTPTLIAGPNTKMRFGVVGMGDDFHTFHIHGHRWTIPGPDGNTPGVIQNSSQVKAVSQFEDTRTFGPANSFVFTIDEGSGSMRADPFTPGPPASPVGEWHLHCHVLGHMMGGMMGSLLIIPATRGLVLPLPQGKPCPEMPGMPTDPLMVATVRSTSNCKWRDDTSGTPETTIKVSGTVTWLAAGCGGHTVVSDNVLPFTTLTPALNDTIPFTKQFTAVGDYGYHCDIHGGDPVARTDMWGIVHVIP